jgi:hypothetical protein
VDRSSAGLFWFNRQQDFKLFASSDVYSPGQASVSISVVIMRTDSKGRRTAPKSPDYDQMSRPSQLLDNNNEGIVWQKVSHYLDIQCVFTFKNRDEAIRR